MNAEALKAVLDEMEHTIKTLARHFDGVSDARSPGQAEVVWQFDELRRLRSKLDEHCHEVEAAERKPVMCGQVRDAELRGQLGNVELKTPAVPKCRQCNAAVCAENELLCPACDEKTAKLLRTVQVPIVKTIGHFGAIETRLSEIEKRLDKIERKAQEVQDVFGYSHREAPDAG